MPTHHGRANRLFRQGILVGLLCGLVACTPGQAAPTSSQTTSQASPSVTLENRDALPTNGRLVFSRIGQPGNSEVHDQVTLRLSNGGAAPLAVSALTVAGPWTLGVNAPLSVPAGGFVDLPLNFVAGGEAGSAVQRLNGSLSVQSNDPRTPQLKVDLAGLWQSAPERDAAGYSEPTLQQILATFGYNVTLTTDAGRPSGKDDGGNIPINQRGAVKAQGSEVISAYWRRADAGQPVSVREIAAYEGPKVATLSWYARGSEALTPVTSHAAQDSQTLLPRQPDGGAAAGAFAPSGSFGFNVDGGDGKGDWSDPAKNDPAPDHQAGCTDPCGQHLRFWPLPGQANTYVLAVDHLGINYDYQDNVYLIRNIAPADK